MPAPRHAAYRICGRDNGARDSLTFPLLRLAPRPPLALRLMIERAGAKSSTFGILGVARGIRWNHRETRHRKGFSFFRGLAVLDKASERG